VVLGGIGTLAVIAAWTWLFPDLRRTGPLDSIRSIDAEEMQEEGEALT
jgi:hypothetical protein